ncbi:hypothetical protein SAMN04487996_10113 [Dyadobacter soli]|uniref:Uncharacterized protein n=1 Tax=Dyadobacter soli TaxID=659014 RepID=A0A1G6UMA5_9BACT|nr:hypothetical protein [Dyadobacter soli]SDD42488.1 hypothetical protein SAMN04487996_10113 [Dyadobacter soli]
MKRILSLTLLLALLFQQCRKKDGPIPQTGPIEEIDVIDISVDGVESKDVIVEKDLIVIHLPENYAGGDFIKPHITFGTGYSSRSELVKGFSFEGKELSLPLESATRNPRTFQIIVIPHKSVTLTEPARDHQVVLGPDAAIAVPASFGGTRFTVNDSGAIVQHPVVVLKNQSTGAIAHWLYPTEKHSEDGQKLSLAFPPTIPAGTYTAEVIWGAKTEVLSRSITIQPGALQLQTPRWQMLQSTRYFELSGYNIPKDGKYEMTIGNDHAASLRIPLQFKNAGALSGELPADLPTGNYKAIYWKDGKVVEPYDDKTGVEKYMGEDQFYIKKATDQPVLRILSQPSRRKSFVTEMGVRLGYFPSFVDVSRSEPIIAYRQRSGAFPDRNDLVLVDAQSKKEYIMSYQGNFYPIFDGFIVFLAYEIPNDVPAGKYEAYMITGNDKTEKYGQFIHIMD